MRPIDADRLARYLNDIAFGETDAGTAQGLRCAIEAVLEAPTVSTAETAHGAWQRRGEADEDGDMEYGCSVCDGEMYLPEGMDPAEAGPRYCPHCGALMDRTERKNENENDLFFID